MGGVPFLKHTPGDGPISVLRMHARICNCTRQILRKRCRAIADRVLSLRKPYLQWHPICFPLPSAGIGSGMAGSHSSSSPSGFYELLGCLATCYLVRVLPICSCKVWSGASARFVPSRVSQRGKFTTTHPMARSGQTCAAATEYAYGSYRDIQRHSEGAITHIKDEGMPVKLWRTASRFLVGSRSGGSRLAGCLGA